MATTETARLGLNKIDDGDNGWGQIIRDGYDNADENLLRDSREVDIILAGGPKANTPTGNISGFTANGDTYTDKYDTAIVVTIDDAGASPNTFSWTRDGVVQATSVNTSVGQINLVSSIDCSFGSTTTNTLIKLRSSPSFQMSEIILILLQLHFLLVRLNLSQLGI